mmetsp:Transcript_1940/g.6139  ORF Transcript_1940/g.6139 Transcript_1940/m.6139 type:complete len:230 (+) Transcript_1940:337-1026(+)
MLLRISAVSGRLASGIAAAGGGTSAGSTTTASATATTSSSSPRPPLAARGRGPPWKSSPSQSWEPPWCTSVASMRSSTSTTPRGAPVAASSTGSDACLPSCMRWSASRTVFSLDTWSGRAVMASAALSAPIARSPPPPRTTRSATLATSDLERMPTSSPEPPSTSTDRRVRVRPSKTALSASPGAQVAGGGRSRSASARLGILSDGAPAWNQKRFCDFCFRSSRTAMAS